MFRHLHTTSLARHRSIIYANMLEIYGLPQLVFRGILLHWHASKATHAT